MKLFVFFIASGFFISSSFAQRCEYKCKVSQDWSIQNVEGFSTDSIPSLKECRKVLETQFKASKSYYCGNVANNPKLHNKTNHLSCSIFFKEKLSGAFQENINCRVKRGRPDKIQK